MNKIVVSELSVVYKKGYNLWDKEKGNTLLYNCILHKQWCYSLWSNLLSICSLCSSMKAHENNFSPYRSHSLFQGWVVFLLKPLSSLFHGADLGLSFPSQAEPLPSSLCQIILLVYSILLQINSRSESYSGLSHTSFQRNSFVCSLESSTPICPPYCNSSLSVRLASLQFRHYGDQIVFD